MIPIQRFGRLSPLNEDLFAGFTIDEIRKSGTLPLNFFKCQLNVDEKEDYTSWLEGIRTAVKFGDREALEEASQKLGLPVETLENFDENKGLIKRVVKILMKNEDVGRDRKYFLKALEQPEFALERFYLKTENKDVNMYPYNFGIISRKTYELSEGYYAKKDDFGRLLIYEYNDFKAVRRGGDRVIAVIDPYKRVIVTDKPDEIKKIAEKLGIRSWELSEFLVSMAEYTTSLKDWYVSVNGGWVSLDTVLRSNKKNPLLDEIRRRLNKYTREQLERDYLLLKYEVNKAIESVNSGGKESSGSVSSVGKPLLLLALGMVGIEGFGALRGYLVGKLHQRLQNDVKLKSDGSYNLFKYMDGSKVKYLQQSDEGIGILANDIDWELNYQRISSELNFAKIPYVRVNNSADFSKISNFSKLLILGGHLAPGIENVTKSILNQSETDAIMKTPGSYCVFEKHDVFRPNQTIVIVAGKTRNDTHLGSKDRNNNYVPDGIEPLIDRDEDGLPVSFDPNDSEKNIDSSDNIKKVREFINFSYNQRGKGMSEIRDALRWLFYEFGYADELLKAIGKYDRWYPGCPGCPCKDPYLRGDFPGPAIYTAAFPIKNALGNKTKEYHSLVVAYAVVWDEPLMLDRVKEDYLTKHVKMYVDWNEKGELVNDLRKLDWEMNKRIVSTFYGALRCTRANFIVYSIDEIKKLHNMWWDEWIQGRDLYNLLDKAYGYGGQINFANSTWCVNASLYSRLVGKSIGVPTSKGSIGRTFKGTDKSIGHAFIFFWENGVKKMCGNYRGLESASPDHRVPDKDTVIRWMKEKNIKKVYMIEEDPQPISTIVIYDIEIFI